MQHILQRERLEKKFVARVVIGRDGFGIGIDHQSFKPVFLQGERGVDAAIIKLNALADAVRAAAQDHHLAFRAGGPFVVAAIVGRVIVRRVGLELGGAGVHQAVARHEAGLFALGADGVLGLPGQMRDLAVGKSEGLGA
jgi:hypothetical protein